jgi:hypothetical protein
MNNFYAHLTLFIRVPLVILYIFLYANSFYLNRLPHDSNQSPILLVPTKQFESLLKKINQELDVHLRIPSGPTNNNGFRSSFPNDGTPRPRYLGRATNRETADKLHADIPPRKWP